MSKLVDTLRAQTWEARQPPAREVREGFVRADNPIRKALQHRESRLAHPREKLGKPAILRLSQKAKADARLLIERLTTS